MTCQVVTRTLGKCKASKGTGVRAVLYFLVKGNSKTTAAQDTGTAKSFIHRAN